MTLAELEGIVTRYMDSYAAMTLACSLDDKPWAAAVYYARQGLDLIFFSSPTSRHATIFSQNPQAAATIHGDYREWREIKGLQMEGHIESVTTAPAKARAISIYLKRHPFVSEFFSEPLSISAEVAKKMSKVQLYCSGLTRSCTWTTRSGLVRDGNWKFARDGASTLLGTQNLQR